jgi:hypothetical protein
LLKWMFTLLKSTFESICLLILITFEMSFESNC